MEQGRGSILVTGATGFIGSHIVLQLLTVDTSPIFCLVRPKGDADSRARLLAEIEDACRVRGIPPGLVMAHAARVHVIDGDVSKPGLDISDASVEALRRSGVREIWHVAASMEYEEHARASILISNVDGTRSIVELAGRVGAGVVNYVSTAYVAGKAGGTIPEALPENVDDPEQFCNAYEHSKAQAEIEIARGCESTGIRYRIFRPSIIIGDSKTYRVNSNFGVYRMIRRLDLFKKRMDKRMPGYLAKKKLFVAGDETLKINILPIDHFIDQVFGVCAAADSYDRIYHIVNPDPPELGYVVKTIGACMDLYSLEASLDDSKFELIDNAFRKSYDFQSSYMVNPKSFANDNVAALIGTERARRRPFPEVAFERYVLTYIEQLTGVGGDRSVFSKFSRSDVEERETTTEDGVRLTYYVTSGDLPTLVLINAFGMDLEFWGPTVKFFKNHFRIITWILRGLPDSEQFQNGEDISISAHVRDLRRILEVESTENAILMGWCSGPKIAIEYYRHYPESVRSLILVAGKYDTLANPDPDLTGYSKLFSELNPRIQESPFVAKLIVDSIFNGSARNKQGKEVDAANTILSACSPSVEYAPFAVSPFNSVQNLVTFSKMSSSLGEHEIYDMVANINVPTLVIYAENDAVAHPVSSRRLASQIKDSELVMLPQASHFCLVENAGIFVHSVSRYLQAQKLLASTTAA